MAKGHVSGTILGLFLMAVLSPLEVYAQSQAVAKVAFEERTGIIVWDVGSQRGLVDRNDDLTDLSQECTIADSSIIPNPIQIMDSKKGVSPDILNQSVAQILEKFGVSAGNFKMTPIAAFVGKVNEPVFLLFPEQHINNPVKQELGELHESLAKDTLNLTAILDAQDIKIVNTMEGPQGPWASEFKLSPKTLKERFEEAYKLMATKWISGGQLIGEVYGDKVLTHNNDNNDLTIQYALSLKAYEMSFEAKSDLNSRWDRAKAFLASRFPVRSRMVQVDSFRDFFDKTVVRSSEEIKGINSQICEARSREMARYSYELAKQQGARVVYMGFGALHAHGVIEQLRQNSASYIVFSPNF
jgi:hypothetical protein